MSGLQFPDSARRAALQAAEDVQITGGTWASCALEAATSAGPHIVAAELRRLAVEARKAAEEWGGRAKQCTVGTTAWESASVIAEKRWFMVSHLEMRATELDGGAR